MLSFKDAADGITRPFCIRLFAEPRCVLIELCTRAGILG